MSSIAGPSSHALPSYPAQPRQSTAILTKLGRLQDVGDTGTSTGSPATPVLTTAPPTAPATPVGRSSSAATDARDPSQGPAESATETQQNGTEEAMLSSSQGKRRADDLAAALAADLDAVKARAIALGGRHGREPDEQEAMVQTATRFAERLEQDHRAAVFPDVDTPFEDAVDVIQRLLPYHVFQQPREDLESLLQNRSPHVSQKGKRKATEEDLLREEIADTKFALECWRRKTALEKRFRKARLEPGKRASLDEQTCWLAQAILETERAENTALSTELRASRAELDKLDREKRAAAPPPSTPSTTTPRATSTMRTSISTSSSYHPTPSPATSTPTTATFMPPYRPSFSYSYSQFPTTQYTYNPHAYTSYTPPTSTGQGASTQTAVTAASSSPPSPATTATPTPTSSASAQIQQASAQPSSGSSTAIAMQLPVSSLTALSSLGIIPVAAASLSPGQAQPAAVIKSTNGTMLSLEINLSLLLPAQMRGLVLILNALSSNGVNVDGATNGAAAASSTSGVAVNGSKTTATTPAAGATTTSAGTAAASASPKLPSTSSAS